MANKKKQIESVATIIKLSRVLRTCLGCPKEFLSNGPGNRMCPRCKRKNDKARHPEIFGVSDAKSNTN